MRYLIILVFLTMTACAGTYIAPPTPELGNFSEDGGPDNSSDSEGEGAK